MSVTDDSDHVTVTGDELSLVSQFHSCQVIFFHQHLTSHHSIAHECSLQVDIFVAEVIQLTVIGTYL